MSMSTKLLRNDYGRLAKEAPRNVGTISKDTADAILEDAKSRVHVVSGATRDSGEVVQTGIGYEVMFSAAAVFEEYGTVHRPPHPFLTPASEAQRSGYLDRLREGLSL